MSDYELDRDGLAAILNRLPFVRWDRCVIVPGGDVTVYGWIARPGEERSDYVEVTFKKGRALMVGYTTSSAARDEEIHALLYGDTPSAKAFPCQRVEDVFGDLVPGAIRLA